MRIKPVTINEQLEYKRIMKRRKTKIVVFVTAVFYSYLFGHIIYYYARQNKKGDKQNEQGTISTEQEVGKALRPSGTGETDK